MMEDQQTSSEGRPSFTTFWRKKQDDTTTRQLTFVDSGPLQSNNNKGMFERRLLCVLFVPHVPTSFLPLPSIYTLYIYIYIYMLSTPPRPRAPPRHITFVASLQQTVSLGLGAAALLWHHTPIW